MTHHDLDLDPQHSDLSVITGLLINQPLQDSPCRHGSFPELQFTEEI